MIYLYCNKKVFIYFLIKKGNYYQKNKCKNILKKINEIMC